MCARKHLRALAVCFLAMGIVVFVPHRSALGQSCSGAPSAQAGSQTPSGPGPRVRVNLGGAPVVLPDTPAGRCVATFLEAFNSGDGGRLGDFENNCRAASQRAKRPAQDRIDQFKQIHDELGDLTLLRVDSANPTGIAILALSSRESALWSMEFEFEEQAPQGLVTLSIKPRAVSDAGGPPAKACGVPDRPQDKAAAVPPAAGKPAVLPDTPAGRCAAAYLEALNSGGDDARVRDFEQRFRAASALGTRSLQDRIDQIKQIHADLGDLTFTRVVSDGPTELTILALASRTGEAWTLGFEFEEQPPHGLVTLRVMPSSGAEDAEIYTRPIDEALRKDTIKQIADLLRDGYVDPDRGRKMAEALAGHEAQGRYDSVTSAADLAQRLTADVMAVYRDGHFGIVPFTGPAPRRGCGPANPGQDNYGFRKAELLPGNIGYIKFDMFQSSDEARAAAAAALAAVAGCDALIFDVRDNVGGAPRMVEFLASYLFDRPTHLDTFVDRLSDKTMEIRTLDTVPGRRFPNDLPVYILTSPSTISAAEGFAYDLKHLGRATIVGAKTAGAAHMVTDRIINDRFIVHLPYAREINPVTKGNWEGVGVEPDIKVPASEALEAALKDAAARLRARGKAPAPQAAPAAR